LVRVPGICVALPVKVVHIVLEQSDALWVLVSPKSAIFDLGANERAVPVTALKIASLDVPVPQEKTPARIVRAVGALGFWEPSKQMSRPAAVLSVPAALRAVIPGMPAALGKSPTKRR
jgi:hypothetical protein